MGFVEGLERLVRQPRDLSRVAARVMVIGRGWEQFLIQRFQSTALEELISPFISFKTTPL